MEIIEQNEAFIEFDDDLVFSHTKVILRQGERYFYYKSKRRLPPNSTTIDFAPSDLHEIPMNNVWPEVSITLTEAPNPLPPNCYVKTPILIEYGDTTASLNPGALLLHEATVCEILREHPHPNIVRFFGCIMKGKRLTGLCFAKYSMNLLQVIRNSYPLDREKCLKGIENGLHHLHKLGLVHNDLNPANVMMDGDTPVIIDFDSCREQGAKLGVKGGTLGWSARNIEFSDKQNDIDGLSKIRDFLGEVHETLEHDTIPHI